MKPRIIKAPSLPSEQTPYEKVTGTSPNFKIPPAVHFAGDDDIRLDEPKLIPANKATAAVWERPNTTSAGYDTTAWLTSDPGYGDLISRIEPTPARGVVSSNIRDISSDLVSAVTYDYYDTYKEYKRNKRRQFEQHARAREVERKMAEREAGRENAYRATTKPPVLRAKDGSTAQPQTWLDYDRLIQSGAWHK